METEKQMTTIKTSKEIVMACMEAINAEDLKTARQFVAEGMAFNGPLGTRESADAYFNDMEKMKLKYDVKKVLADETDVCVLYNLSMAGSIIFCCGWYTVKNDKIVSLKVVFDPRPILEQKDKK